MQPTKKGSFSVCILYSSNLKINDDSFIPDCVSIGIKLEKCYSQKFMSKQKSYSTVNNDNHCSTSPYSYAISLNSLLCGTVSKAFTISRKIIITIECTTEFSQIELSTNGTSYLITLSQPHL